MNVREISAAVLFLLSPALYFIVSETPKAAPYQTTAEHGLLLITVPVGLVLVWLTERRPPAQGQQPMPVWARLLFGGATGLLLTVAVIFLNATALRNVQELPGTSLGTSQDLDILASHALVQLDDGRTVHLLNAFCGVNGARVTVFIGQGLLRLDRVLACALASERPKSKESSEGPGR
ncbi:MAG TPA: hypothetical protein VE201_05010 [Nitrospirales bacterium]|nr:hypothetical protein [Nitrospirales bacterium]